MNRQQEQDGSASRFSLVALAWLDSIASPAPAPETAEKRRQLRLVAALSLTLMVASFGFAVQAIAGGQHSASLGVNFLITASAGLLVVAQRFGAPVELTAQIAPGLIFVPCAFVALASAGDSTGALVAFLIVPLFALVIAGAKAAMLWTGVVWLTLGLAAALAASSFTPAYAAGDQEWQLYRFPIVALETALITSLGFVFHWIRGQSQSEIQAARDTLAESEARYRALSENAGDLITEFDSQHRVAFLSSNCFEVTGFRPEELLGKPIDEYMHPDDLAQAATVAFGDNLDEPVQLRNVRMRHASGHWMDVEVSVKTYRTEAGEDRIVTVARDLSELRSAQLAVRARHSESRGSGRAQRLPHPKLREGSQRRDRTSLRRALVVSTR